MGVLIMTDGSVDRDLALSEELQDEWVRVTWAAKYLGIDPKVVYRRVYNERLKSLRLETGVSTVSVVLVSREQILNWDPAPNPPKSDNKGGRPRANKSHQRGDE